MSTESQNFIKSLINNTKKQINAIEKSQGNYKKNSKRYIELQTLKNLNRKQLAVLKKLSWETKYTKDRTTIEKIRELPFGKKRIANIEIYKNIDGYRVTGDLYETKPIEIDKKTIALTKIIRRRNFIVKKNITAQKRANELREAFDKLI